MQKEQLEGLECAHCQQAIKDVVPSDDGQRLYCCYGCKVVDELLENPSPLLDAKQWASAKFNYLDEAKIRARLLDFDEAKLARLVVHLPAIHCSSCIFLLENLAQVESGILAVQVHFSRKEATISFRSDQLALSQVAALLDYVGYPPDFKTRLGSKDKSGRRLLIQMGVAGFFFGNTMLLALPEYFDESLAADPQLQAFFRYLMLLFSLPVLLYSARDYYRTAYKGLRAGSLSIDLPIAVGVSVLFLRSAYEVLSATGPGYFDSLTGLVFFLLVGKWYQAKTYQNFSFDRDLRSFLPLAAQQLVNGEERAVAIDELAVGDEIVVRQGEILPADAELRSERSEIDYSYLTGESLPLSKSRGESVFAGARITGNASRFVLRKTVDHSYLSSLWGREAFAESAGQKQKTSLTDKISQYFTPVVLVIALLGAAFWSYFDSSKALFVFTAVLIVACPCALALAEPFAAGSLMRWYGRQGFFLKNSAVLRRLQELDHVVFDKTGTLTEPDSVQVEWHGDPLSFAEKWAVATLALNAQHPLAKPLLRHLAVEQAQADAALRFEEASGEGVGARVRGAYYRMGKASFLGLQDRAGTTAVYLEKDALVLGYFSFYQKIRPGLAPLVQELKSEYKLSLLSGDNQAERRRFGELLGADIQLHFDHSPHQKLDYLHARQAQGERLLMLGDGLNDAGALQQAEVGISLCEESLNFFPASDALLQAGSFPLLGRFLRLARQNKGIVREAFALSLAYNVIGVSVALAGLMSPLIAAILMPISSVTVVLYVSLKTTWQARL